MKCTTIKTIKLLLQKNLNFMLGLSFLLWWIASPAWFSSQAIASTITSSSLAHGYHPLVLTFVSGQSTDVEFRFVDQQSGEGIPFVYVFIEEI